MQKLPPMLIRAWEKQIYLTECCVAESSGLLRMHLAQHHACNFCVLCRVAGKLSSLGSKSRTLGQSGSMDSGLLAQFHDCFLRYAPSVCAGKSHSAPCVAVV